MILFEKEYAGYEIHEISQDVLEAFMAQYNPKIREIPCDQFGLQTGTFKINITWEPEI